MRFFQATIGSSQSHAFFIKAKNIDQATEKVADEMVKRGFTRVDVDLKLNSVFFTKWFVPEDGSVWWNVWSESKDRDDERWTTEYLSIEEVTHDIL
jgi:uncharacterized protein YcnI